MTLAGVIKVGATVAGQVYRHRKTIYAVLTAQDRYISNSFRYGGYGKATSYGVRSGALAGTIAGSFINKADDSPGNGLQKTIQSKPPTRTPYQTRGRFTTSGSSRSYSRSYSNKSRRCTCPSKYNRSRNRF